MQTVIRLLPMFSSLLCNVFVGIMAARNPVVLLNHLHLHRRRPLRGYCPSRPASYWAFGFPAGFLSVVSANFVFASGILFIAKAAYPHEQSVASTLFQTVTQVSIFIFIRSFSHLEEELTDVSIRKESEDNLNSYEAAQWTSFAFAVIALVGPVGVYFPVVSALLDIFLLDGIRSSQLTKANTTGDLCRWIIQGAIAFYASCNVEPPDVTGGLEMPEKPILCRK
ncbi:hypothetical protein BDQ12DRAFT_669565 [Crucibulum laeve]|uniref:Uncharacterized protein n=1 Tax=Crucibulum laeve TaxID=68775 RepID=A0A5C3LPL8_9AGAR|nr:hypothetical protein BDQ12DRAFT_669565 [Crucibulum laeve]